MRVEAVVVAAGSGARFGGPKQYASLAGRPVLDWSVAAASSVAERVVLVVPADRCNEQVDHADVVVAGGPTRSSSVRAGLAAISPTTEVVVIHDAARPLATPTLFEAVVTAVGEGADGAVPGLPVIDTVKRVGTDGVVVETLLRDGLVAVQTPQAFSAAALRSAHAGGGEGTDDAALVEQHGGRVVVVAGEADNLKITTGADLQAAEAAMSRPAVRA